MLKKKSSQGLYKLVLIKNHLNAQEKYRSVQKRENNPLAVQAASPAQENMSSSPIGDEDILVINSRKKIYLTVLDACSFLEKHDGDNFREYKAIFKFHLKDYSTFKNNIEIFMIDLLTTVESELSQSCWGYFFSKRKKANPPLTTEFINAFLTIDPSLNHEAAEKLTDIVVTMKSNREKTQTTLNPMVLA